MPRFMQISKAFRIGQSPTKNYSGIAVASADAFFLIVGSNALATGLGLSGGLVGGFLAGVLHKAVPGRYLPGAASDLTETDLAELPVEVTGHPDWPVKSRKGPVIVVPRPAIRSVRYSFWKWGIFLETKDIEFRLEPPFFGRKKVLAFLREIGWEV